MHLHMSCYVFEFMDFCFVGVTFFGHLFKTEKWGKDTQHRAPGQKQGTPRTGHQPAAGLLYVFSF